MRQLRDNTHLLCVTKTVSPAVLPTLCCQYVVQTLCCEHCVGGILWEHGSSKKKWRKLDGRNRLPEIIRGVEFRDGLRQPQAAAWSGVTNFCAYLRHTAFGDAVGTKITQHCGDQLQFWVQSRVAKKR